MVSIEWLLLSSRISVHSGKHLPITGWQRIKVFENGRDLSRPKMKMTSIQQIESKEEA
jgi:hypothetical protein